MFSELAARTRPKNPVDNGIRKTQGDAQPIPVTVTDERTYLHAHRLKRIMHRTRRFSETIGFSRKKQLHARTHIHQMARCGKGIPAVVAAARKDRKHLVHCSANHCGSLLGRPPSGIFHQSKGGQTVVSLHSLIDSAHILCKRYIHR